MNQNNNYYTLTREQKLHNLHLTKQNIEKKLANLQTQLQGINKKIQQEEAKAGQGN